MARAVISSKYQVVIPKEIRSETGLKRGQRLQVISKGGVISLVPETHLSELRGLARGIRGAGLREKKDRL